MKYYIWSCSRINVQIEIEAESIEDSRAKLREVVKNPSDWCMVGER
jgi:hypothetical protein